MSEFYTASNVVILLLIALVVLLIALLLHTRAEALQRERKLRIETVQIQEQILKIFRALRDEVTDQVLSITVRKKLSQKEETAVSQIHQALEVSKKLIDKEVRDVKKMLNESN